MNNTLSCLDQADHALKKLWFLVKTRTKKFLTKLIWSVQPWPADVWGVQPPEFADGEDPVGALQLVLRPGMQLMGWGRLRHQVLGVRRLLHLPPRPPARLPATRPRRPHRPCRAGGMGPVSHCEVRTGLIFSQFYHSGSNVRSVQTLTSHHSMGLKLFSKRALRLIKSYCSGMKWIN